jgi:hypothetical protein
MCAVLPGQLMQGEEGGVSHVHAMQALDQVEIGCSRWRGCDCSLCPIIADDGISCSPFGCHVADSDVAPGFNDRYGDGLEGEEGVHERCAYQATGHPFIVL